LRELSRVFQGVLCAPLDVVKSEKVLTQLWRHDMDRLFADKLSTRTRQCKWRGVQAVDGLTAHDVSEPLL